MTAMRSPDFALFTAAWMSWKRQRLSSLSRLLRLAPLNCFLIRALDPDLQTIRSGREVSRLGTTPAS